MSDQAYVLAVIGDLELSRRLQADQMQQLREQNAALEQALAEAVEKDRGDD